MSTYWQHIEPLCKKPEIFACLGPSAQTRFRTRHHFPRWKAFVRALACAGEIDLLSPKVLSLPGQIPVSDVEAGAFWMLAFTRYLEHGDPPPKDYPPRVSSLETALEMLCQAANIPVSYVRPGSARSSNPRTVTVARWAERLFVSPLRFAQPLVEKEVTPWDDLNTVVAWSIPAISRYLKRWFAAFVKALGAKDNVPQNLVSSARLLYFLHGFSPPREIPDHQPEKFEEALTLMLQRRGMTPGELGNSMGVSHAAPYAWVSGHSRPKGVTQKLLAAVLKLPIQSVQIDLAQMNIEEELAHLYTALPPVQQALVRASLTEKQPGKQKEETPE